MGERIKKIIRNKTLIAGVIIMLAALMILVLTKKICPNQWIASRYEVKGVDVSHYQGDISWEKLEEQGISFAFIKATEGSSHVDERFCENWKNAKETKIYIGAYHFFSFDSPSQTQAELFVNTAGELSGNLPPVVDVEYYGDKEIHPPDKEKVVESLREFLVILEAHYQVKPIIYTTYKFYHRYIEHEFDSYPLWIRNVYYPPSVDLGREWVFWQYSDTAVLEGYTGAEPCIDLNVFYSSEEELKQRLVP